MSTLYIRLPSHAVAGSAPLWPELPCAFALMSDGKAWSAKGGRKPGSGVIEREGVMPLPGLAGEIAEAQGVVLLLAAADVALLRVKVPPLSQAKLKAALPNLIEDQLIGDPSACVIAAGDSYEGLRTVAVVERTWFGLLTKTLIALGARRIAAIPAQLCLPAQSGQIGQPDAISVAVHEQQAGIDLTVRLSEHDGIGLTIAPAQHREPEQEPPQTTAHEIIRTLQAIAPGAPVTLYVPQAEVQAYRQAVDDANPDSQDNRISVQADDWAHWVAGAAGATVNLMAGRAARRMDWRAWRWPLALAAAVLIVNSIALNLEWWRKSSEARTLRASLTQIYKAAYPKETVIIDPIAQMQQKIATAKRDSGLPMPDDFTALVAGFGEAAAAAMPGRIATAIAAIEYREHSLIVQFKPGIEAPAELAPLLADRSLSLDQTTSGSSAVLRIRSTK